MNNKSKSIDVVITDYKQCFDGMWLEDCLNDLYEAGVQNPNLALIHATNTKNKVAVKAPNGISERVTINDIVMQGEVMAPLECSVSVDTFGKECQKEEKYLYYYRDLVGVPSLSMVDDVVNISECGVESVALNAYINAKSNSKKLQFGKEKCHKLHIGCNKESCPELFLDTWKIEETDELNTGRKVFNDVVGDDYAIENSDEERYLGDLITSDGRNTKNLAARKAKAVGIVDKIMTILNDVFFGHYFFQVALTMRVQMLLSSILLNSESWYNLSDNDIQQLETVDNMLHRRILECPRSTKTSILHLELGTLPIRYLVKSRRLLFLQYLLKQEKESLMYKFFEAQSQWPQKGDWISMVKKDVNEIELNLTFDEISVMSDYSYNTKVKNAIRKTAFNWLITEKNKPSSNGGTSKGSELSYTKLKLQDYFLPNSMTIKQCNLLFSLRAQMFPVRCNYRHSYTDLSCPICQDQSQPDNQLHALSCSGLFKNENIVSTNQISYNDIFSSNVMKQTEITKCVEYLLKKRKALEKQLKNANHIVTHQVNQVIQYNCDLLYD